MSVLSSPNAGELLVKLVGSRLMASVACISAAVGFALPRITCPEVQGSLFLIERALRRSRRHGIAVENLSRRA